MATLVPLSALDDALVNAVLDRAFGPDRHARTAYRIRAGMNALPALSFAALDEDDYLVGTIQAWPIALTDTHGRAHPLVMVGPVAVLPERQGEGFGVALVTALVAQVDGGEGSPLPQVLIGDADYYGRWGFSREATGGWRCPGPYDPGRLLARYANPAILPETGMLGPWSAPDTA